LLNHAIPRTGLFSQSAALSWIDSSWGFDLLTAASYRLLGLAGLPMLLLAFQIAIAITLFFLARGASKSFWPAVILVAIGQYCISPVQPRSTLCSILFFAFELTLLLQARRSGNVRTLYWLPPIFLVWANLDRQFSYGLLALALFCLAAVIDRLQRQSGGGWLGSGMPEVRLRALGVIAGACVFATFGTPYGYRADQLVWTSALNPTADRYFRELHAMRFRRPEDYLLMLLMMTAFFALGRRRSRDLFVIGLMLVCSIISFRLQRDSWLVVVASIGVIANAWDSSQLPNESPTAITTGLRLNKLLATAFVVLLLIVVWLRIPARDALMSKVSESFPVRAADYIRQNQLPQPLFNTYSWGGFLTWYLPEYPVVIDGRVDLYGDALNIPYFKLMGAELPAESHPGFARSQTILLESNSPIGQALATIPGFRVAYRDNQAIVLVRGF
jgi:hypothetical protein